VAIDFNADEVFEMAEMIERRAVKFYGHASDSATDPPTARLFAHLAELETQHEQVFGAMKDSNRKSPAPSAVTGLARQRWRIVADLMIAELDGDLSQRFRNKTSSDQIIREALSFERDTVVFFLAMKDAIPPGPDRNRIDPIIKEEMGHIIMLGSELAKPKW
jgi:rubrerythrin